MTRQVHCPGCGAVGTIAPCDNKVFQRRGVFEGKSAAKCKKCACGLFFGPFSGTYFGKPKLIPKELWLWLNDMVQYFVDFAKNHDTIGFLIYDEEEFNYAKAYASLGLTPYYNKNLSVQFAYAAEAYTSLGFKYYCNKQFEIAIWGMHLTAPDTIYSISSVWKNIRGHCGSLKPAFQARAHAANFYFNCGGQTVLFVHDVEHKVVGLLRADNMQRMQVWDNRHGWNGLPR